MAKCNICVFFWSKSQRDKRSPQVQTALKFNSTGFNIKKAQSVNKNFTGKDHKDLDQRNNFQNIEIEDKLFVNDADKET